MTNLPKILINTLEQFSKYLYSNNYIIEFSDSFFQTESIEKQINKHFEIEIFTENVFSFLIDAGAYNIYFLIKDNIVTQKKYSISNYRIKNSYDLRKRPYLVKYNDINWISKHFYESKTKPTIITRTSINDSFALDYSISYSSSKTQVKTVYLNYGCVYKIYVISKGSVVSIGETIDQGSSNIILNQRIKAKNIETFSRHNSKIKELIKIFEMVYY